MKEHLLHFAWQNKLFNTKDLTTVDGNTLQILDAGKYNTDGGPDFHHAKIKIGDMTWVGSVELHVQASDWKLHGHHQDKKYGNVILHVVYFNDKTDINIPTLELNGRISSLLLAKYESLMLSRNELVCKNLLDSVDEFTIENWKERLVIERLERKSKEILKSLSENNNDWELVCYRLLGKYFGSHINKDAFELLVQSIDHKILQKHAANTLQTESLLFGTAGFLEREFEDDYPNVLRREHQFLQHKYRLKKMQEHQWQFLRMRPVSFPTIRIAWFAKLVKRMPLFGKLLTMEKPQELLENIFVSDYWKEHYIFDRESKLHSKILGDDFASVLLINVFAPLLFAYGRFKGEDKYVEKSLELLLLTHREENNKTKLFELSNWPQPNAFHTQAAIELYDHYCTSKRCLQCSIGHKILRTP